MAWVRGLFAVAGTAAALLVAGPVVAGPVVAGPVVAGPVVAGGQEPAPTGDRSRFENATVVSGLSMIVERPVESLVAGRDTTYTIGVNNSGEDPETVTIRVTVPPWMPEVRPMDGGELGDGFVDWPVTVAPGEVAMLRLTGRYASPGRDAPTRVAFTACALEGRGGQPIVCATDIAHLEPAPSGLPRWLLIGGGVVVAGAGAVLALRLRRRIRSAGSAGPAEPAAL
jgi:hypothetical protein